MPKVDKGHILVAILCTLAIVMLGVFSFSSSATAGDKDPVKIGLVTFTEGPAATSGSNYTRAFNAGIKHINDRGGIVGGRKIEGVIAPQGMTGVTAKTAAMRLAMKDGVKALIGPQWTIGVPAGLSVAKKYSLPFTSLQGGTWLYEQKYPGTAIFAANAYGRGNAEAKWAEKMGYKKVVIIAIDIKYNRDVVDTVKKRWEKPGSPELVDTIWYTWGKVNLKQELTKAVGYNPDLIWTEEWSDPTAVGILKDLHELGFKGDIVITPGITRESARSLPREVTEGVYTFKEWVVDPKVPENKAFCDMGLKEWGELPDYDEKVIWTGTVFILLAMDKAGTVGDGTKAGLQKINKAMHSMEYVSPHGPPPVNLSEGGLAMWDKLAMARIKDGEFVLVDYIQMEPSDWLPWM